jgi:hypothetical protein
MTRIAGNARRNLNARVVRVAVSLAAALALLSMGALPAYAWTSSFSTTTPTTVIAGSTITDASVVSLSNDAGPYGSVVFAVYSGSCTSGNPTGVKVLGHFGGADTSTVTVTASGAHPYSSGPFSTTGLSGSYVWVAYYTGTGSGGYPRAPTAGYHCEPFTVNPPSHGVPEFPVGLPALLALALPLMILLRRKLPSQ